MNSCLMHALRGAGFAAGLLLVCLLTIGYLVGSGYLLALHLGIDEEFGPALSFVVNLSLAGAVLNMWEKGCFSKKSRSSF
jgi:hypothetical protein